MRHKKILVAFDKSRNSKRALLEAVEILNDNPEAVATVLFVCDKPTVDDDVTFDIAARLAGMVNLEREGVDEIKREYIENELENLAAEIEKAVAPVADRVAPRVIPGKAHEVIPDVVKRDGFDLVVIGSRGMGALTSVLGSVTFSVLRSVETPVLVIK